MKLKTIDNLIIFLMFFLLPVDMVNGIMLKNNISLPITIGQLFKIVILLFICIRLLYKPHKLFLALFVFSLMLLPSIIQSNWEFILYDTIKISKYLAPFFCFLFFVELLKDNDPIYIKRLFKLVKYSYFILAANILVKYLGLGYPMYQFGDIGSKGFFYAGNEISALFLILSSILGFKLWKDNHKMKYFLFFIFNLFIGITISSKTGMLGVFLVFSLIPLKGSLARFNIKRLKIIFTLIIMLLPIILYLSWKFIENSVVFVRLEYFWKKLDFWTFVLSHRNEFFNKALLSYKQQYNFFEKIIGVGQYKYKYFNNQNIIEIDIIDIFFAYGLIGVFLFFAYIVYLFAQSRKFIKAQLYPFSNYVLLMLSVLLLISTTAGHVFSSGMAAVFIGLLFSLMFIKKNENI